uniref:Uncharacterized protein n=1 Tax=Anguilla anguilla TaxID=7936 RepID=A0A0E9SRC0_ANGAN
MMKSYRRQKLKEQVTTQFHHSNCQILPALLRTTTTAMTTNANMFLQISSY